jgi:hypothetical protein
MTTRGALLVRLAGLGLGLGSILAFRATGDAFYRGYRIPQGFGMAHLLPEELAFITLFVVWGGLATLGLGLALRGAPIVDSARRLFGRLAGRPTLTVYALTAFVLAACAALAVGVLGHAVISDDEHVYRFIAQTLNTGALSAPSPGGDYEFFAEQFVVLSPRGRYGKYPIGFPLLLAAGQRLGAEALVVPAVTALLVPLTFAAGALLLERKTALLAALLVALSPQVLATGATWLSQSASAACLAGALVCLLAWERRPSSVGLVVAAGALLGLGVLVRPLPGVLFALAALGWVAWRLRAEPRAHTLRALGLLALPLAASAAVILACNHAQSGSWWTSGYQAFHRPGAGGVSSITHVGGDFATQAMSLVGSLLRLNVWLFGWPVSLFFLYVGRRLPGGALLWSMIAAAVAYRVISPKVGVGGAGPLYFFEVVPVLCLVSAHGLVSWIRREPRGGEGLATVLAAVLVSVSLFMPVKLADLKRMGEAQLLLPRLLATRDIHQALVFHRGVVPPSTALSWAYFPRCNGPALDDDVLFVQYQPHDPARNLEFWKRRYPNRSAWAYRFDEQGPRLVPLAEAVNPPR